MKLIDYVIDQGGTGKIGCPVLAKIAAHEHVRCSPKTLYMIGLGHKKPSVELAAGIEFATENNVSGEEVLPEAPWDLLRGRAAA